MSLLPSFLRDVDDVAQIKRELSVGSALFDALIALGKRHIQRYRDFDVSLGAISLWY